ncbi:MAG TPA: hypothetical protein VGO62_15255 [Myxococcota bacterium]|jgi:hypothetical protein
MTRVALAVPALLGALLGALSCVSTSSTNAGAAALVVASVDGTAWTGAATYTVRTVAAGGAERVVGLPGLGELLVDAPADPGGPAHDDSCRLVWSRAGLDHLVIFEPQADRACVTDADARVCFRHVRFTRPGAIDVAAPQDLVVDGCADENHLLYGHMEGGTGATAASVGPSSYRQRCVPIPHAKGCDLVYLHERSVAVHDNDAAERGFNFSWDGDAWRACFLERDAGAYDLSVDVEDSCAHARTLALRGNSAELDD